MIGIIRPCITSFIVIFTLICIPANAEEKFTSGTFLTQPLESRSSYIRIATGMASLIAVENDKKNQADCIGSWYFSDQSAKDEFIFSVMRKYPDHHPLGVILAVVEKQCGSFKYGN